jgi:hypothetical protein
MKRLLAALALVIAGAAARGETPFQLKVHDSLTIQINGATAAYAIDETIAAASGRDGIITIFGRAGGTTRVMVVALGRTVGYDVVVIAPVPSGVAPVTAEGSRRAMTEARYLSTTGQVQTAVDAVSANTQLHAVLIRGKEGVSIPSASYRIAAKHSEITLLDHRVDDTPLTTAAAAVRGFHLSNDAWHIHAGVTAATFYDTFVLPAQRHFVFGASGVWHLSPSWSVMPSVYLAGRRPITSILAEYADGDRLRTRTEIGYSRGLGGAFQLAANRATSHVRADLRWQPRNFATAGVNDVRGFIGDVNAGRTMGKLDVDLATNAARTILPSFDERSLSSTLDLRYHVSRPVTLIGGATYGTFQTRQPAGDRIKSFNVPIGAAVDLGGAGVSAVYRVGDNTARGRADGFRFSGSYSHSTFHASAFLDRQNNAPTIALFTHDYPELANDLARAGISATSMADISRLLREGATLAALGITNVPQVDLALHRTQTGADVIWRELRLRYIRSDAETVSRRTSTAFTTLTWIHRIAGATDVEASYGMWITDHRRQPTYELALRHRFDGLPSFGSRTIAGSVYRDDDDARTPLGGIEVRLDDARTTRSDSDGRYEFTNVGASSHQLSAHLPAEESYFTTRSRTTAVGGDTVDFGVAFSPARLKVVVVDDAGRGIAGVNVTVAGARRLDAVSGSDGAAGFIAQPGVWKAAIADETLAAGYTLDGDSSRDVTLQRSHTTTLTFVARANRTVSGRVAGVHKRTVVAVEPLGRSVMTDENGRFAIRSLPSGSITLRGAFAPQSLVLPLEPAVVADILLLPR